MSGSYLPYNALNATSVDTSTQSIDNNNTQTNLISNNQNDNGLLSVPTISSNNSGVGGAIGNMSIKGNIPGNNISNTLSGYQLPLSTGIPSI